jgi:hypothetical protein
MFQANIVEEIKTHVSFSSTFFDNRAVYQIMWKNTVQPAGHRWQCGACWIPTPTNTRSDYVTLVDFSTETMVAWTRLAVTLRVHASSCLNVSTLRRLRRCCWMDGHLQRRLQMLIPPQDQLSSRPHKNSSYLTENTTLHSADQSGKGIIVFCCDNLTESVSTLWNTLYS